MIPLVLMELLLCLRVLVKSEDCILKVFVRVDMDNDKQDVVKILYTPYTILTSSRFLEQQHGVIKSKIISEQLGFNRVRQRCQHLRSPAYFWAVRSR